MVPPQSIRLPSISYKNTETPAHKLGNSLIFSVLWEHSLLLLVKISAYSIFFWTLQHCSGEPNKGIFHRVSDFKSFMSNMHWVLYKQLSTKNLNFRAALRLKVTSCAPPAAVPAADEVVRMALVARSAAGVREHGHSARMGASSARIWNGAELVLQCPACSVCIAFATNFLGAEQWLGGIRIHFPDFIWFKSWSGLPVILVFQIFQEQPCWEGVRGLFPHHY